jgi:hypothetical protein
MGAAVSHLCSVLFVSPFLAIVGILAYSEIQWSVWRRKKRKGKRALGFCPSSVALAAAFLLLTTFYRPRMEFAIEASEREEVEEDDLGDPETPEKHFNRQLRRIRRGESVERLELRL